MTDLTVASVEALTYGLLATSGITRPTEYALGEAYEQARELLDSGVVRLAADHNPQPTEPNQEDIDLAKLMVEVADAKGIPLDDMYRKLAAAAPSHHDHEVTGVEYVPVCDRPNCWQPVAQNDDEQWEHVT